MYRFLLSRRWLGLFAAALAVAAGCAALGVWQLDRLQQRRERNHLATANLAVAPVPPERLLAVGRPLAAEAQWRRVSAQGRYDTAHELLVRNRPLQGAVGYHVLTPLVTEHGPALLVDRGWVRAGETAATRPDVPPPPAGVVAVIGRMRVSEPPSGGDPPPAGQVTRIDVAGISRQLPYDVYGGYAELLRERPAPAKEPARLPLPELGEGPHLAYAFQWFVFGLIALIGVVVLARREAQAPAGPAPAARPRDPRAGAHPGAGVGGAA